MDIMNEVILYVRKQRQNIIYKKLGITGILAITLFFGYSFNTIVYLVSIGIGVYFILYYMNVKNTLIFLFTVERINRLENREELLRKQYDYQKELLENCTKSRNSKYSRADVVRDGLSNTGTRYFDYVSYQKQFSIISEIQNIINQK